MVVVVIGDGIEISVTSTSTSTSSNDKKPAKRILVGAEAVKARAAKASSEALLVAGGGSAEDTAAAVVRLLRARTGSSGRAVIRRPAEGVAVSSALVVPVVVDTAVEALAIPAA